MLVNTGKVAILELVSGKNPAYITTMSLGTSTTAADATQTDLVAKVLTAAVSSVVDSTAKTVTFTAVFQSQGSTYREYGLYTSDGAMVFRTVIGVTTFVSGTTFLVSVVIGF